MTDLNVETFGVVVQYILNLFMESKVLGRRKLNQGINDPNLGALILEVIIKTVDDCLGDLLNFGGVLDCAGTDFTQNPGGSLDDEISWDDFLE